MSQPQDDAVEFAGRAGGPSGRMVALAALGILVVVLALVVLVVRNPEEPRAAAAAGTTAVRPTATSAPARTSSSPATAVPKPPAVASEPRSQAGPEAQHEVAEVAAGLPAVSLTSPVEWDRWLPEGKPFPGADLADDISTCPVLSARLETVTGQKMSYWSGTLPGPGGCTWAETPLDYDSPDYDYVVNVGFETDDSDWFPIGSCARLDVPSIADGAVLARCEWQGITTYVLAVPDTRLEAGRWVLGVQTKPGAPVRAAQILPVLLDGVVAAFG